MAGRSRRPSRARLWLGLALLAVGAVLLGYVGWQLWGTNVVARQDQQRATADLEQQWSQGQGPDAEYVTDGQVTLTPSAGSSPTPASGPTTVSLVGQATALVRIPRFGTSYVVPVYEGTSEAVLARGFGHFLGTAGAGQVGNYALAAHRITHGQPLRAMPELRPGDTVIVETRRFVYTYVLDTNPNDLVVPFTQTWVLAPVPDNPKPGGVEPDQTDGQALITLTTCSELFHTDDRMVAFGHLVDTERK